MEPFDEEVSAGGYWLQTSADEYTDLRHHLVSCLQGREVDKLEIWKIENVNTFLKFERRSSNMLTLPCWLSESSFDSTNTVHNICTKGFNCKDSIGGGIAFFHGSFDSTIIEDENVGEHVYIYSDVCVGRSFVADPDSDKITPTGYDSLYLLHQKMDRNNDGEFSIQEYQSAASFDSRPALYVFFCVLFSSLLHLIIIFFPPLHSANIDTNTL